MGTDNLTAQRTAVVDAFRSRERELREGGPGSGRRPGSVKVTGKTDHINWPKQTTGPKLRWSKKELSAWKKKNGYKEFSYKPRTKFPRTPSLDKFFPASQGYAQD